MGIQGADIANSGNHMGITSLEHIIFDIHNNTARFLPTLSANSILNFENKKRSSCGSELRFSMDPTLVAGFLSIEGSSLGFVFCLGIVSVWRTGHSSPTYCGKMHFIDLLWTQDSFILIWVFLASWPDTWSMFMLPINPRVFLIWVVCSVDVL